MPPPSPPGPAPEAGRAWSSPGLLRRVEARRVPPSRPPRRTGLWPGLHHVRWSAEGAMMILVSAVCIALLAVAISALHGGPGVTPSGTSGCAYAQAGSTGTYCSP